MELRKKMNIPDVTPDSRSKRRSPPAIAAQEELVEAITRKVLAALGK